LGKTYGNLMVDLQATNSKLVERSRRTVAMLTGLPPDQSERVLSECGGELKTAIVAQLCSLSPQAARQQLARAGGHLRKALEAACSESDPGGEGDGARK
jgi:N-acetylmuramic acid 6-phosphate etherase